ncbi:phosphotransferase [Acinetobacter sp. AYS6]|uniref:phosphotransferase n=1 Tax=Acinetobacter sp. AYS6 TaxID=2983297 RepID=UPI0021D69513|nr:phosphotransferase [Acinetobacter sp. AYS6]MCU7698779.1 phosphotransferase [Acinetobacter sp. AYS6]
MNTQTIDIQENIPRNLDLVEKIKFEFRFDRDFELHKDKAQTRIELIQQVINNHLNRNFTIDKVDLYPVARAGKSGSEVFYFDYYITDTSTPRRFIAKFQDKNNTNKELEAATRAEHHSLCTRVISEEHSSIDLGVIVYDLAKVPNHQEFRGFFLEMQNSHNDCAIALDSVFRKVCLYTNNIGSINFMEDFSRYLNRKNKPLERIKTLIESSKSYPGIYQLGDSIFEHYSRVEKELNFPFVPYLVHGDLHARNLILDAKRPVDTELIDFGWSHYGHPAKDFVLIEATLKYMLLAELLQKIKRPSREHPLHISIDIYEEIEDFLCKYCFELPTWDIFIDQVKSINRLEDYQIDAIQRVYLCISSTRKAAQPVLEKFCATNENAPSAEKNYFASLFLVVLGLSGYDEMELIWTLIGLDKMGAAIWQYH